VAESVPRINFLHLVSPWIQNFLLPEIGWSTPVYRLFHIVSHWCWLLENEHSTAFVKCINFYMINLILFYLHQLNCFFNFALKPWRIFLGKMKLKRQSFDKVTCDRREMIKHCLVYNKMWFNHKFPWYWYLFLSKVSIIFTSTLLIFVYWLRLG